MTALDTPAAAPRARFQLLDLLRGIAILAMVVFHIGWDLYYFGFMTTDVTTDPFWVVLQKAILSSFLILSGASLVLATERGVRWPAFWRRFGVLLGAALLVTAGTWLMFPDYFVFFGVLHAIALFSLAGVLLRRLPAPALLALGALIVGVSFLYTDPAFTSRTLGWIGFWPVSPPTSDVVPIFPWLGVFLVGMAAMRLLRRQPALARGFESWHSPEPLARGLAFLGRWSLVVYLVHQPVLIAGFYGLMALGTPTLSPPVTSRSEDFTLSCTRTCTETGADAAYCSRYCDCALEAVAEQDLWDAIGATEASATDRQSVAALVALCSRMAEPGVAD